MTNDEARLLLDFRAEYNRLLSSPIPTGEMVRAVQRLLTGRFAPVAEDAKLWLVMEHGLDVDRWERRMRQRNGEGGGYGKS